MLPSGRVRLATNPLQRQSTTGPDHVWLHAREFGRVKPNSVVVATSPSIVDHHIGARSPSELLQAADECLFSSLLFGIAFIGREEHADPPHPLGLLRARGEWPSRRRATEERDELASLHGRPLSRRLTLPRL